ncbi:MAG TPA: hypothetical protein VE134_09025, partial [Methanomicrobiales archaeon]|nr:hypothetical protein [Methanomicrobiales archaeon]
MDKQKDAPAEYQGSAGMETSVVYHLTVMDGFLQEAESRMRKLLKGGSSIVSDPAACRKAIAGLCEVFEWY